MILFCNCVHVYNEWKAGSTWAWEYFDFTNLDLLMQTLRSLHAKKSALSLLPYISCYPQLMILWVYKWIKASFRLWKCVRMWVRVIHTPCPSSLTLMLCSRSLMIWAACSQRSGGPLMWATLSGPVPSSVRKVLVCIKQYILTLTFTFAEPI